MNELALFAGAGGGILGGKLLGWRTVCAVEWEPYPASVLCARQNDGLLETFPIWDDIQTFDGRPWRGIVQVVSGGFPCQDISAAGKGAGIDGERSGMWREMARIIREVRPRFVFVENSPMLTSRGLGTVLGDLASMGFDARWGVLGAANVGAPHQRDRIWIVAKWRGQVSHSMHNGFGWREQQQESAEKEIGEISNANSVRPQRPADKQELESQGRDQLQTEQSRDSSEMANTKVMFSNGCDIDRQGRSIPELGNSHGAYGQNDSWWKTEPNVGRVADGIPARVDRLKAIGNAQVPLCAATAWRILSKT